MNSPKILLLSLSITAALAACQKPAEPAATAAKPAQAAAELPPLAAFNVADLDTSKNACVNLADFVNSKWLAANPVPSDKTSWGSFEMLDERSVAASKGIAEAAAANTGATGIEKLVGDLYASGMDTAKVEAAGIAPMQPMLDRIAALKTPADIAQYLRDEFAAGRGEVFAFGAEADFKKSSQKIGYAFQGGLSLPEKAYYLEDGPDGKYKAIREAFVQHVSKQLQNAGVAAADADTQAKDVLAFETRLAKASLSPIELRNPENQYHYVTIADADKASPNFKWSEFFKANGVQADGFSLSQPKFFAEFDKMLVDVPLAQWQAYLRINAIDGMAPYLADKFNDERFDFYSRTLRGQKDQKPRWKRVMDTVENTAGEALGQLYVKQYFPATSKARVEAMVSNILAAFRDGVDQLAWMSPATKTLAKQKAETMKVGVGYPDTWRDYSALEVKADDPLGNALRAAKAEYAHQLAKLGKTPDRGEWWMTPQTVNAVNLPLQNAMNFPAAILEAPFFDPAADDAANYGAIGAVIGHEISHGFDNLGAEFDAQGRLHNWWTPEDAAHFKAASERLVKQYDAYEALPGLHINGQQTLGENIADVAGLQAAYVAYHKALGGKPAPVIDGLTGDQRFFLAFAQAWREKQRDAALRAQVVGNEHAPGQWRALTVRNIDAWYETFGVKDGQKLYLAPEARVKIW